MHAEQLPALRAALDRLAAQRLRPPPTMSLSEWADAYRMLSPESSAEPGRWRTSRVPYLRAVMDAVTDPDVHTVVTMKAAQVAYTEMLNSTVAFFIHQDPTSILVLMPNVEMAEAWSKERLAPMLRDTPVLRGTVSEPRSRASDNTIRRKAFAGGHLAVVGANAPSGLASRPIHVVLADEVDRYEASAGTEGDPLSLAMMRQATFWNCKTLIGSTPGRKGASVVEREYLASDRRRYHVPCPDCRHPQVLRWAGVVFDRDDEGDLVPGSAAYRCEVCGSLWTDAMRWADIAEGEWIAERPFNGVAGFHIPGFLSSFVTLDEIAGDFLRSRPHPATFMRYVNTVWGEPWEERGERTDPARLAERVEPYDADNVPDGVVAVTAGVDHQDDRLEVTFVGWGEGEEAWVLEHRVLPGEVGEPAIWNRELDQLLRRSFTTAAGRRLLVRAACVDSGGHFGNMVHAFCRTRRSRRIVATKGLPNGPRGSVPIWSGSSLRSKNAADKLFGIGVDTGKDDLAARLRVVPVDGEAVASAVHFPFRGLSADYFEQLTAEEAVTELNREGRPVRRWKLKPGQTRNEALDCFVLAYAALLSLPVRLTNPARRTRPAPRVEPPSAASVSGIASPSPAAPGLAPAPLQPAPKPKKKLAPRQREPWNAYR